MAFLKTEQRPRVKGQDKQVDKASDSLALVAMVSISMPIQGTNGIVGPRLGWRLVHSGCCG